MSDLLDHLARDFTEPVRDPIWGNIFLTPRLEKLAASTPFVKLARIKQLGPTQLVYPGATHTRRAHSLGVFHMAKRLVWALAAQGSLQFVSRDGLESYLVAALCHDLGHFPYAHSLKELPLAQHEALTAGLLLAEPLRSLAAASGADPEAAAAIVDETRSDGGNREIRFFRGLLSGVLDPDKLDYLNRDAFFCGVPYGTQDTDFILQRVSLGSDDRLGVEERGLMSVESLLFAKYLMYRSVYWHKGVRSATAMIKKAVLLSLKAGALMPEELYGLDDDGFHSRLRNLRFPGKEGAGGKRSSPVALAEAVFEGRLYRPILDIPFDEGDARHRELADLGSRTKIEEDLASKARSLGAELGELDVVIDLPEPISFETDLPVLQGEDPSAWRSAPDPRTGPGPAPLRFSESQTVFTPLVVADFALALRRLRVFVAEPSDAARKAAHSLLD